MLAIKCLKGRILSEIQIISRHSSTITKVFNKSMVGLTCQGTGKRSNASLKSQTNKGKHWVECTGICLPQSHLRAVTEKEQATSRCWAWEGEGGYKCYGQCHQSERKV